MFRLTWTDRETYEDETDIFDCEDSMCHKILELIESGIPVNSIKAWKEVRIRHLQQVSIIDK